MPIHSQVPPHLIPLHLSLSMLNWQSSMSALNAANHVWPNWKQQMGPKEMGSNPELLALVAQIAQEPKLAAAVREEAHHRLTTQVESIRDYYRSQYIRKLKEPPILWQSGNCRLLDYSDDPAEDAPAILLIPSLINRYYVLDLTEQRSLARFLAGEGYPVYLVDWGIPGEEEKHFSCSDYVTRYLSRIGEKLRERDHEVILAAGHCMGGMLAMGLATIRRDLVDGLVLLATPWDFSADAMQRPADSPHTRLLMEQYLASQEMLPGDHLLALFYLRDPWIFQEKLKQFAHISQDGERFERFLAIEDWVNSCVPLPRYVAKECLLNWTLDNTPLKGEWRVGGRRVLPEKLDIPTLIATGQRDRIVPLQAALPLVERMPDVCHLTLDAGHVGMIVGSDSREQLWDPLCDWIDAF